MGPFFVLVDGSTGALVGTRESDSSLTLYRHVGPHFFDNAKNGNQIVRRVTITLVGDPVSSESAKEVQP